VHKCIVVKKKECYRPHHVREDREAAACITVPSQPHCAERYAKLAPSAMPQRNMSRGAPAVDAAFASQVGHANVGVDLGAISSRGLDRKRGQCRGGARRHTRMSMRVDEQNKVS